MKRFFLFLLAALPSCAYLPRPASSPLKSISAGPAEAEELVVFLPGRWSLVSEFEEEGFLDIARERFPKARLVVPDLHLGYYKQQSAAKRLHQDIILPAKASGTKTIRLIGISMGGLGALIYDLEYPGEIDQLILLSPFLGEEEAIREIQSAGGLKNWKPGPIAEKDFSRRLWKGMREKYLTGGNQPRIILGCGESDRLKNSNELFAQEFLSEDQEIWLPGGHDWETWRKLFSRALNRPSGSWDN